ncbi:hypothetical protein BDV97DRAFT_333490 [Delphinella strobiligena]|nr:hypothetical protein BDV97DRAFT_333490 [Delphinella strobiligena]
MVIARESPRAKVSPDKNSANWPPKSPHEALLSSPSGRKRWDDVRERFQDRDVSPSPRGKSVTTSKALQALHGISDDEEDEDEDEEMLRLKLQAIEAKLKLKKLQNKKKLSTTQDHDEDRFSSNVASPRKRLGTSSLLPGVQVPVSPIKDRMPPPSELPNQHTSPARVLLGIDKGLKAKDVSLKRARNGTQLANLNPSTPDARPTTSFNQRLAATRLSNEEQEAKADRVQKARSTGFALPGSSSATSGSTPARRRDSTEPSEDGSAFESYSSLHLSKRKIPHTDLVRGLDAKEIYTLPRLLEEVKAPHYDPPDCESDFVVFAIIASKSSPYTTKAKHHMNSSTEPDTHEEINPRNKFMVMTLTDLKWEVDLFLFDTAFTQFWKMTPGTLVAILNPNIMPPKTNQHNGRFSLKLASSEDSVLEIGTARDLGFCKSIKKDGKECGAWVNKRKTQFCDYHVELAVEKTRRGRMEVNSMYRPTGAATNNKPFKQNSRGGMKAGERSSAGLNRDRESGSAYYMGGTSGLSAANLFDAEDMGKADAMRKRLAAREKERILGEKLGRLGNGMGAEYLSANTSNTLSDKSRRTKAGPTSTTSSIAARDALAGSDQLYPRDEIDPETMTHLLGKKAADVDLGPAKGRKRAFGASATTTTGSGLEAMGWGGANRHDLLYPKNNHAPSPEKGQTTTSSQSSRPDSPRKRARFDIKGKGLREPGRESLGTTTTTTSILTRDAKGRVIVDRAPDSSDDDLDIV